MTKNMDVPVISCDASFSFLTRVAQPNRRLPGIRTG